jgi:hypothetical protein
LFGENLSTVTILVPNVPEELPRQSPVELLFTRRKTHGASGFLAVSGNFHNSKLFALKYIELRIEFGEHTATVDFLACVLSTFFKIFE